LVIELRREDGVEKLKRNPVTRLILALFLASILSMIFATPVKAQYAVDSHTVALWHFDEVNANNITLDATGNNPGTLVGPSGEPLPMLVDGKIGKALNFDGNNGVYVPIRFLVGFPPPHPQPIYIPISTSLDIPAEIKIEAWINVNAFKNVTYNNIVVKATRNGVEWQSATRIYGLAVNGITQSENGITVPQGVLRGYVTTDTGGFNEIVTTEPIIMNQWIQVTFTRNLMTGMHIYVNGIEQSVTVTSGVQNPVGSIINGTELWIGHDAKITIDEVRISNLASTLQIATAEIDIGPNLLAAVVIVAVVFAITWLLRRVIQTWGIRSKSKD
jgi:hypothetical protein